MKPGELKSLIRSGIYQVREEMGDMTKAFDDHPSYYAWRKALDELRDSHSLLSGLDWGSSSYEDAAWLAMNHIPAEQILAVFVLLFDINLEG